MALKDVAVNLTLYNHPNYSFTCSLEDRSYRIRLYYNERMASWVIDLSYSDRTPIILGQRLTPQFPLFLDYNLSGLSGYFHLVPIGKDQNYTSINPLELYRYYELYYVYQVDDGEE